MRNGGAVGPINGISGRRLGWTGMVMLGLFVGAALASLLTGHESAGLRSMPFQPPCWAHPLGTDDMGNDLLKLLLHATPVSLMVGLGAGLASVLIGTTVGLLAGFLRGVWGEALSGWIDVVLLIPLLPFMLLLSTYLGPGMLNIILAIALIGWCSTARTVRARVLQLRQAPFMEAAAVLGFSGKRILLVHLLPNVSDVVSAKFVLSVAGAMLSEAALSFMGLGDPVRPSWGQIMHYAFQRGGFANGLWNWYLPPGLCITACTLGFIFLGLYWESRSETTVGPEWER